MIDVMYYLWEISLVCGSGWAGVSGSKGTLIRNRQTTFKALTALFLVRIQGIQVHLTLTPPAYTPPPYTLLPPPWKYALNYVKVSNDDLRCFLDFPQ